MGTRTKMRGMVRFLLALPLVILIGIALGWVGTQINSVGDGLAVQGRFRRFLVHICGIRFFSKTRFPHSYLT